MQVCGGLMNMTDFLLFSSVGAALSAALARKVLRNIQLNRSQKNITELTARLSKLKLNLRNQMLKVHMDLSFTVQQIPELEYKLRSRIDAISQVDFNDAYVFARYFQNLTEIYEGISSFAGSEENTIITESTENDLITAESSPEKKYECLYTHHRTMVIFTLELLKANERLQVELNKLRSQLNHQGSQTEIKFNVPNYKLQCLSAFENWIQQEASDTANEHQPSAPTGFQMLSATP